MKCVSSLPLMAAGNERVSNRFDLFTYTQLHRQSSRVD